MYLLSNDVLSKNLYGSNFANNVLRGKDVGNINALTIFTKLICYYFKSFLIFNKYILEKIIFNLNIQRFSLDNINDSLIVIDTFLLTNNVIKKRQFKDQYFLELDLILESKKINYVYLPVVLNTRSLIEFQKLLKILNSQTNKVLLEYQLIKVIDYIELFNFMIKYPLAVISLCVKLKSNANIEKNLKNELLMNLNRLTIQNFSRYLIGKRVAKIAVQNLKVISWYENQVIDKNFYRGIKKFNSKIEIIGAKAYVSSDDELNTIPDEFEKPFLTLPDKIVVNSNYQIPKKTKLNYVIGPSFRYKKLFETKIDFSERSQVLVLCTIYDYEIRELLGMINRIDIPKNNIMVKFHPAINNEKYLQIIQDDINVVDDDLYNLFRTTKIVIGISTGTLIEAACMAIPSIVVSPSNRYYLRYFNNRGKGIIWDYAEDVKDINALLEKFSNRVDLEKKYILEYAREYKNIFFSEPTSQLIEDAFGL